MTLLRLHLKLMAWNRHPFQVQPNSYPRQSEFTFAAYVQTRQFEKAPFRLHEITDLRLRLVPGAWPIDAETRTRIDRHCAERIAANPNLWKGGFAAFLAWKDWGCPEIGIRRIRTKLSR